jgi:hypothetical protein
MIVSRCALVFLLTLRVVSLVLSGSYDDGSDLSFYVSVGGICCELSCYLRKISSYILLSNGWKRPDIRSPKMTVKTYDENAVLPGYIFTAPYYSLKQESKMHAFYPAQIGPHIYDSRGVSGTHQSRSPYPLTSARSLSGAERN